MPSRRAFGADERAAVEDLFEHYRSKNADFGFQDVFERRYVEAFVEHLGVDGFADAVGTGTAALYVAVAALRLPPGSRVLVSPVTDPGTVSAIILNGLVPVLMDSASGSYNTGLEQFLERASNDVRAAIVVHVGGKAADAARIAQAAQDRGVALVEDCSQAHGARHGGRRVGTFGDVACFSTMYRKAHATGGCGGVVFTQSQDMYRLVRAFADRGKPFWLPEFDEKDPAGFLFPALNLNQDELACAIGWSSLRRLDDTIHRRVSFLRTLGTSLMRHSKACSPTDVTDDDSPFFHPIRVDAARIRCTKQEFARAVAAEGIDLNPHYRYIVGEWPWASPYLDDAFLPRNATAHRDASFNLLFNEHYGEREANDIVEAIVKVEAAFLR